ncbi:MAG: hypothetical protein EBR28_13105, partial [Planctomycetia bacterium]|nr:hypothetical protein [Planctomycetia bacterium]
LGNNFALGSTGTAIVYVPTTIQASTDLAAIPNTLRLDNGASATVVSGNSSMAWGGLTQAGGSRTLTNNIVAGKSLTIAGTTQLSADSTIRTLSISGSGNTVFSGPITNGAATSGTLQVTGTTRVVLSASNSFTGGVTFSSGSMAINNNNALGTGTMTWSSGNVTLDNTSGTSVTFSNPIRNLSASGTFQGTGNSTLIHSGTFVFGGSARTLTVVGGTFGLNVISGTGATTFSLTKDGAGTMIVSGSADPVFQGGFRLNGGTLVVGHANALGTGTFTSVGNSPTIQASADLVLPNAFLITGTTSFAGANSLGFGSDFVVSGATTRTIFNGIGGGKSLSFSGTTYLGESGTTAVRGLVVGGTGATTFGGPINNGLGGSIGSLTIANAGTTTLSGSNGFTGVTAVNAGVVALANANALANSSTISFGGGTLQYGPSNSVDYSARIAGSGSAVAIDTNGQNVTFASALGGSNTGGLVKAGAGTLTLSQANTFTGTTSITGGSLVLGSGSSLQNSVFDTAGIGSLTYGGFTSLAFGGLNGSGNIALTDSGSAVDLTVGGGNASSTYGGVLSGLGSLTKTGTGTLVLTGSQTYAGATTIAGGTLQLGAGGSTGWISGSSVTNNGVLVFNRSDAVSMPGVISGTGAVVLSSTVATSVVTLSGANSYTGGSTVLSGSLVVQGNQSAATGGWMLGYNNLSVDKNVLFDVGSTVVTASNKLISVGPLVSSGSNNHNLTVLGTSTNYGGLAVARNANLNINSGGVWLQSGSMQITPQGGGSGNLNVNAGGLFTYSGTDTIKLNGSNNSSGSGSVTITGGTFVTGMGFEQLLSSTNGNATITLASGGVLRLSQDIAALTTPIASGSGNLLRMVLGAGGGGTIDTNGFTTVISSTISGTGGLTKAGPGTLTLTATNTYTGTTTVNSGTLRLSNASALSATTPVTVNAGTLDLVGNSATLASLGGTSADGRITSTFFPNAVTLTATAAGST